MPPIVSSSHLYLRCSRNMPIDKIQCYREGDTSGRRKSLEYAWIASPSVGV